MLGSIKGGMQGLIGSSMWSPDVRSELKELRAVHQFLASLKTLPHADLVSQQLFFALHTLSLDIIVCSWPHYEQLICFKSTELWCQEPELGRICWICLGTSQHFCQRHVNTLLAELDNQQ